MVNSSFSLFASQAILMLVTKSPTSCFVLLIFFLPKQSASMVQQAAPKWGQTKDALPVVSVPKSREQLENQPKQRTQHHRVDSLVSLYRCCPRQCRGRGSLSGRRRRSEGVPKEVPHTHPRLSKPQNNCSLRKQGKEGLPWAGSAISEGKSKTIPNLPCLRLKRKERGIMAENRLTLLSARKVGQEGRHGFVRGQEGWLLSPRAPRGCTQASEQGLQCWGSPQQGGDGSLLKSALSG